MARPKVWIGVPDALWVGRKDSILAEVVLEEETRVEFIEMTVRRKEGWVVGYGKSRKTEERTTIVTAERVQEAEVLPAGTHRYRLRVELPPGTPPTHELDPAYVKLWAQVHVSLPWRFDVREKASLVARVPPPEALEPRPTIVRSHTGRPDQPRMELGLPSTVLASGHQLAGTLAVFHLDDREEREVLVTLAPLFTLHGHWRTLEEWGLKHTFSVTVRPGGAGKSIPFRLQLPEVPPSFASETQELSWKILASSGSLFSGKVSLQASVEIVDGSAAEAPVRPPDLADERIHAVFSAVVGTRGWRDAAGDVPTLILEVDGLALSVAYAYRGREGTFLISRVTYPRLGLGLSVAPSSPVREALSLDIEVGVKAWDRTHHVDARSAEQTLPFLEEVVPDLMRASNLGKIASWGDEAIVFEQGLTSIDAKALLIHLGEVEGAAGSIARARGKIVPPLDVDVAAWDELARWLDGTFTIGDLSVEGVLAHQPVAVGVEWDEARPARLRARIGAAKALHDVELSLATPAAEASRAPPPIAPQLARWPADWIDLRIADGVASAAATVIDAAQARALVEALAGIMAALGPAQGPYR